MTILRRILLSVLSISVFAALLAGCARQEQESTAAAPPPASGTASQPAQPPVPAPEAEPVPNSRPPAETAKVPDDFPLPLYEGFTVTDTLRTQAGDFRGIQLEITGNATPEAVAQFYEAEFNKRGLKVSKMSQKTETGNEVLVLGQSDQITAGIAATREDNKTRVVLSWSEKK